MIPYWKQYLDNNDIESVINVLKSDFLTTGPMVKKFEDKLCEYTWTDFAISCWNWTQALHLAYLALWIWKWDEVITTANTFVATSNMIIACWAKPVFCDIKIDDYNIDENKIESLITENTKAISVVHFAWRPCNMNKIWDIAKKYNLKVIEDAAHALWASYNWIKIWNTKSDLTTFSFHPVKPITTWEWWAVLTNNKEYYEKMLKLRSHWIVRDENGFNDMIEFGFNYRITDIQCALWISQLKKLDNFIAYRKKVVKLYSKYLGWIDWVILPKDDDISDSWWHLYVVRFKTKIIRDNILKKLRENWFWVTLHYPPVYSNTYYRNNWYKQLKLENSEKYFETCLSLPIYYNLEEENIKKICNLIKN